MPTDALLRVRDIMNEMRVYGFQKLSEQQRALGDRIRQFLKSKSIVSVAAEGFEAPTVVVSFVVWGLHGDTLLEDVNKYINNR